MHSQIAPFRVARANSKFIELWSSQELLPGANERENRLSKRMHAAYILRGSVVPILIDVSACYEMLPALSLHAVFSQHATRPWELTEDFSALVVHIQSEYPSGIMVLDHMTCEATRFATHAAHRE